MFAGKHINATEDRAVLHVALRAARDAVHADAGANVVPAVWAVLDKVAAFSHKVRSGEWVGVTGKPLTTVVAIGIGGSYLGPAFVHAALGNHPASAAAAAGRRLVFLANVDPVDAVDALKGLDPETTLAVIVSKTFTTAETMRNARTVRAWLAAALGAAAVGRHMVAVSTNLPAVEAFGMDPANAFGFWDWVGGRFSVSSAVGVLPLALQYGFPAVEAFLGGMRDVDAHFASAPLDRNLPVLMGLLNVWNATFLGRAACALLPYSQALSKFAPHVQQLSMESNGKGVGLDGRPLAFAAGEIDFGEPGTNGQHSFYQLLHQGRVVPAEFIGVAAAQQDAYLPGEPVSSHEELMCNFFAQPDALAVGKTGEELRAEGTPEALVPHKTFQGARQGAANSARAVLTLRPPRLRLISPRLTCPPRVIPPSAHRQPPLAEPAPPRALALHPGPAPRALRGPRRGVGLRVGHQLVRPVGRAAGQGAGGPGARRGGGRAGGRRRGGRRQRLQRQHPAPAQPLPAGAPGGGGQRPARGPAQVRRRSRSRLTRDNFVSLARFFFARPLGPFGSCQRRQCRAQRFPFLTRGC